MFKPTEIIRTLDKYLKQDSASAYDHIVEVKQWLEGGLSRFLGLTEKKHIKLAKETVKSLDALEAYPVLFGKSSSLVANFIHHLNFAETLFRVMEEDKKLESKVIRNHLFRRILGLKYRLERVNGGLTKTAPEFALDHKRA
jgi:hypothetical protein